MKWIKTGFEIGHGVAFDKEAMIKIKNLNHARSICIDELYSDDFISDYAVQFPLYADCFLFRKVVAPNIVEVEVTHYQNGVANVLVDFSGYSEQEGADEALAEYEVLKKSIPYTVW